MLCPSSFRLPFQTYSLLGSALLGGSFEFEVGGGGFGFPEGARRYYIMKDRGLRDGVCVCDLLA